MPPDDSSTSSPSSTQQNDDSQQPKPTDPFIKYYYTGEDRLQTTVTKHDKKFIGDVKKWLTFREKKGIRTFGNIGTIGKEYTNRNAVRDAGVHIEPMAGISYNSISGEKPLAVSVVASGGGGYADSDFGNILIYSGSGGGSGKDQCMEKGNYALLHNHLQKVPVRVIRGFKQHSRYRPDSGYRYDGLYWVTAIWMDWTGSFFSYKFRLVQLQDPDKPPKQVPISSKYDPSKFRPETREEFVERSKKQNGKSSKKKFTDDDDEEVEDDADEDEPVDENGASSSTRPKMRRAAKLRKLDNNKAVAAESSSKKKSTKKKSTNQQPRVAEPLTAERQGLPDSLRKLSAEKLKERIKEREPYTWPFRFYNFLGDKDDPWRVAAILPSSERYNVLASLKLCHGVDTDGFGTIARSNYLPPEFCHIYVLYNQWISKTPFFDLQINWNSRMWTELPLKCALVNQQPLALLTQKSNVKIVEQAVQQVDAHQPLSEEQRVLRRNRFNTFFKKLGQREVPLAGLLERVEKGEVELAVVRRLADNRLGYTETNDGDCIDEDEPSVSPQVAVSKSKTEDSKGTTADFAHLLPQLGQQDRDLVKPQTRSRSAQDDTAAIALVESVPLIKVQDKLELFLHYDEKFKSKLNQGIAPRQQLIQKIRERRVEVIADIIKDDPLNAAVLVKRAQDNRDRVRAQLRGLSRPPATAAPLPSGPLEAFPKRLLQLILLFVIKQDDCPKQEANDGNSNISVQSVQEERPAARDDASNLVDEIDMLRAADINQILDILYAELGASDQDDDDDSDEEEASRSVLGRKQQPPSNESLQRLVRLCNMVQLREIRLQQLQNDTQKQQPQRVQPGLNGEKDTMKRLPVTPGRISSNALSSLASVAAPFQSPPRPPRTPRNESNSTTPHRLNKRQSVDSVAFRNLTAEDAAAIQQAFAKIATGQITVAEVQQYLQAIKAFLLIERGKIEIHREQKALQYLLWSLHDLISIQQKHPAVSYQDMLSFQLAIHTSGVLQLLIGEYMSRALSSVSETDVGQSDATMVLLVAYLVRQLAAVHATHVMLSQDNLAGIIVSLEQSINILRTKSIKVIGEDAYRFNRVVSAREELASIQSGRTLVEPNIQRDVTTESKRLEVVHRCLRSTVFQNIVNYLLETLLEYATKPSQEERSRIKMLSKFQGMPGTSSNKLCPEIFEDIDQGEVLQTMLLAYSPRFDHLALVLKRCLQFVNSTSVRLNTLRLIDQILPPMDVQFEQSRIDEILSRLVVTTSSDDVADISLGVLLRMQQELRLDVTSGLRRAALFILCALSKLYLAGVGAESSPASPVSPKSPKFGGVAAQRTQEEKLASRLFSITSSDNSLRFGAEGLVKRCLQQVLVVAGKEESPSPSTSQPQHQVQMDSEQSILRLFSAMQRQQPVALRAIISIYTTTVSTSKAQQQAVW